MNYFPFFFFFLLISNCSKRIMNLFDILWIQDDIENIYKDKTNKKQ